MIAKVGEEEEKMKTKITGFSLTCKYASETRCLAEKQKRHAKHQRQPVLDAHVY